MGSKKASQYIKFTKESIMFKKMKSLSGKCVRVTSSQKCLDEVLSIDADQFYGVKKWKNHLTQFHQ